MEHLIISPFYIAQLRAVSGSGRTEIEAHETADTRHFLCHPFRLRLKRLLEQQKLFSVPSTNSISHHPENETPRLGRFHLIFNWCFNHFSYQLIRFFLHHSVLFCLFSPSRRAWKFKAVSIASLRLRLAHRSARESWSWLLIFLHLFSFISTLCGRSVGYVTQPGGLEHSTHASAARGAKAHEGE